MRRQTGFLRTLLTLVIFATLFFIVYYNREKYIPLYESARLYFGIDQPCSEPILFYIGDFDNRFGQSKEEFESHIEKATLVWNNVLNKELFKYAPLEAERLSDLSSRKLEINLIFDSRQKVTNDLKSVGSVIDNQKMSYESLKAKYSSLESQYKTEKSLLDSLTAKYASDKSAYDKEVKYWNARGGATKDKISSLEAERLALNQQAKIINEASTKLNSIVLELNSTAKTLNSLGSNINKDIGTYNTISTQNGAEFEEAEYVKDENGQRINVYQYSDLNKLIRVLIHEFGHVLNIDHVDEPKAIMYPYNQNTNLVLTEADIEALKAACQTK